MAIFSIHCFECGNNIKMTAEELNLLPEGVSTITCNDCGVEIKIEKPRFLNPHV